MNIYEEEDKRVKRCIYQGKMWVNEQFGRKKDQLFLNERSKAKSLQVKIVVE